MSYVNTFNENKNYEEVRFQFGQKPVSQEFNEMQSIQHQKLFEAFDVLFEPGFIYSGCELLSFDEDSISIGPGQIHLDGFARAFETQTIDISSTVGNIVDIYAVLTYTEFTKEDDLDLVHPLQPDLPIASRARGNTLLTVEDPEDLSTPPNFLRRFFVKVLQYDKTTNTLTRVVTNLTKFLQLGLIPGQITVNQIQPGTISVEQVDINIDGLSIRDALALRMDDANGNFLAYGGAVKYVDNDVNIGVIVRLEAFRAYVKGFLVKGDTDNIVTLAHTETFKVRNNESKVYQNGQNTYSLTKRPVKQLLALDGDVTVLNQNITRSLSSDNDPIPAPFTPVVQILDVTQIGGNFVQGVDYELDGDDVRWLTNNRPAGGSTYQVDFVYRRAFEIGTDVELDTDRNSITFIGSITPNVGSSFQTSYEFYLPRIDSIAVDHLGNIDLFEGVPAERPKPPLIPQGMFALANITLPAGTKLGNTFLVANGYSAPGPSSINFRKVQIVASKMRDHQQRAQNLVDIAFNDAANTALNYFVTKDPSLTKKGTFADAFFDDRLSDYGDPNQNMVFNSEFQQGEGSRINFTQIFTKSANTYLGAKFHGDNFLSLNYTETPMVEQLAWTGEVNLDPFVEEFELHSIFVPNPNIVFGQVLEIHGSHWNFGEENIQFFINDTLLTGVTVVEGDLGSIANSVTPNTDGRFVVKFTVPNTIPIGYRMLRAESQVTGNNAEFLLGVQTAAAPAPPVARPRSVVKTPTKCGPCGSIRNIRNSGNPRVRKDLILKHPSRGETQRFDCNTCKWKFIRWYDPIAQTFVPGEDSFITSVEVFFTSKDPNTDVAGSIILTKDGEPDLDSGRIGTAIVAASDVNTNGTSTKFVFEKPVFVNAGVTYAFYLETPVTGYRVQFAKLGGINREQYDITPAGYNKITSRTSSPKGPLIGVPNSQKRDRNTTHRWTEKTMSFTVSNTSNLYVIDAPVYIGQDAGTSRALVTWSLTDTTTNTLLWSEYRLMNRRNRPRDGKFCVKGMRGEFPEVPKNNDIIVAPIGLVTGHQYQLRVSVDQGYPGYKFIRDDYPADNILNADITLFTQATRVFTKITENALSTGVLWRSPDGEFWQGAPDEDLRIRINKADFTGNEETTVTFKPFKLTPGVNDVQLLDSFTHFTTLLNAVSPKNTDILMEYTLDGGVSWTPHIPVVFKQLEENNDEDRSHWAFFNFGFFSDLRFREEQIDPIFVPSNPNKEISVGGQTNNLPATQIQFRLKLSTSDVNVTPVVDISNWSVFFEKYGLQTTYISRTTELPQNADSVKVYVWAKVPSGVAQEVALTLDGFNTINPIYVTKNIPDETRVIDTANDIVEYTYEFTALDLSTQVQFKFPKVHVNYTTTDRFVQPVVKRVSYNAF